MQEVPLLSDLRDVIVGFFLRCGYQENFSCDELNSNGPLIKVRLSEDPLGRYKVLANDKKHAIVAKPDSHKRSFGTAAISHGQANLDRKSDL